MAASRKKTDEPEIETASIRLVYAIAGIGEAGTIFHDVEVTHTLRQLLDKGLAEYVSIDGFGAVTVGQPIEVDESEPVDA